LFDEVFDFKPTKGVTGIRLRAPWGRLAKCRRRSVRL
jgi:hypothetical protein